MDKIIPFNKGIRRQPSLGSDGELSECVNLVPQNGELVNVRGMERVNNITLGEGDKYAGMMDAGDKNVYIATNSNTLKYIVLDKDSTGEVNFRTNAESIRFSTYISHVTFFGNALVLYAPHAYYLLLDGYTLVGFDESLVDAQITFGLKSAIKTSVEKINTWVDSYAYITLDQIERSINQEFRSFLLDYINEVEKDGFFVNNFLVRYAYRMFDGNLKSHSSPVLMTCNSKTSAVALKTGEGTSQYGDKYSHSMRAVVRLFANELYMKADKIKIDELRNSLSSIVRSIDIFVCPIINYESSTAKSYKKYNNSELQEGYNIATDTMDGTVSFTKNTMYDKNFSTYNSIVRDVYAFERDKSDVGKDFQELSTFFLLDSIKLEDIKSDDYMRVGEGVDMRTLPTREVMIDGFSDYTKVSAAGAFMYNGRLIRYDISKNQIYEDQKLRSLVGSLCNANHGTSLYYNVVYEVDNGGRLEYLTGPTDYLINLDDAFVYLFVPIKNIKHAYITKNYDKTYKISFKNHSFLYGSYAFANFYTLLSVEYSLSGTIKSVLTSRTSNMLQISEVYSPFTYLPQNEVVVGGGEIIGISTATKALSEGQFGEFPLYVFCTDGVWALNFSQEGLFALSNSVSRDVCNNPDSITQIDDSVIYTTDQGLKIIQGSEARLLSAIVEGHNVDESVFFKSTSEDKGFFDSYGESSFDSLVVSEARDFREILRSCRIIYDYVNMMLRIFPEPTEDNTYKYYVYSFDTHEFSSVVDSALSGGVHHAIMGYPSSMVQSGNKLYRPMETERTGLQNGLLLTRPLLFDEPFALKKLQAMRLQYSKFNAESLCKAVLWVSNDGVKWSVLGSLRGGSYKYFRIAVITKMSDADALTGAVVRYELNRTNKLR